MTNSEVELLVKSMLLLVILVASCDLGISALIGAANRAGPEHD